MKLQNELLEAMQQIDSLAPDVSAALSYDESRSSSSTANTTPIVLFKPNLMNIEGKKHQHHYQFNPLTADLEMVTFIILISYS